MQVGTRSKIFTGDLDDDDDEKAERIITKKRNSSFFRRRTTVGAQKKANEAGGLFAQQNKMRAKPLQDSTFEDIEVECANAEYRLLNLYHKYTKHAQMLQQEGEKRVQRIYKRMKREEREQYCKQQLAQLRAAKAAAAAASATSPGRRRPLGIGDSTVLSHESTVVTNTDSGTPQPVPFSPRKDIGFTGSLTLGRRPNHTAGSLSGDGGGGTPAISPTSDGASRLLAEKPPHSSSLLPSLLPDGATKPQLPYIHVLDDDEGPLQNTNTSMTLPGAGGNTTKNQKSFFSTFTTNSSGGGADIPSFWYGDSTAPEPEDAIGPVGAVQLIEVSPDSLPVNVDVAVKSTALNSLSVGITDAYPSATTGTRTGVSRTVFPHSSISPMARSSGGKGAPVSTTQRTVSSSLTPPIPQQTSFFSGTTPRPETTSPRGTSPALAMHATSPVMNLSTFQKEHRSSTPPPQGPATVLPTTTQKRSSLKGASLTRLFLARVHRQLQNREVEKMREKFKTTENPKTAPSLTAMAKEAARKVRQQPVDATFQNAEPLPVSRLLQGGPQDASLISSQPLAQLHDEEARHFFTHINPVRPARIPLPEASVNAVSRSDTGKHIPGSSLTEEGLLFPGEKPAADNSNQKEYELKRLYKRQLLPSSSPFMTYYSAAVLNLEVVQPPVGTTLAGQTSTLLNNSSDMNSLNFKDTIVHGGTVSSPPASPQSNPLHQRMHGTATCLSGGRKSRESTPRQASSTPSSPNNTKRRPSQTGPRPAPKPKFKGVGRAVVSKTHLLVVPREEGLHRPVLYKPLCHAASQQLRTVLQDMKKIRKREYLSRQQYSGDHISALSRIHRLESEVAERRFQQQARENLELVLHHKANSSTGTHPHPANSQGAPTVDTARSVSRDSSPTTQRMSVGSTGYSLSKTVVDAVGPRKNTIPMDSFLPRFGTQTVGQGEARGGEKKNGGNGGLSPVTPRPSRVSGPSFLPTIM